jgi:tetratricopeptide (TPR) repeat protein
LIDESLIGLALDSGFVEPSGDAEDVLAEAPEADDPDDLFALADQQLQQHADFDSIRTLKFAVLLFSDDSEPYDRLGRRLFAMRDPVRAIACLRSALARDASRIDTRHFLAGALWDVGNRDEAIIEWTDVLQRNDAYAPAHARLAVASYYAHDYAEAWTHVHAAEALNHELPPQFRILLANEMLEP